jgi:hypothetical protein
MALFGFFKSNRELWLEQIHANPTYRNIIVSFFIKDNISIAKYQENQKANKYVSFNLQSSINAIIANKITPSPTFRQYLLIEDNRSLEMPEWFYCAYPDVFIWFNDNDSVFEKELDELERIIANLPEDIAQQKLLRFMIDKYLLLFNKLECTD